MKTRSLKKYQLIILLSVIAVGMIFIKINQKDNNETEQKVIQISPTQTPTPTEVAIDPRYPLWDRLPYSGTGFTVEKYVSPKKLAVKAKGLDRTIVAREVFKWLKSFGEAGEGHELSITY